MIESVEPLHFPRPGMYAFPEKTYIDVTKNFSSSSRRKFQQETISQPNILELPSVRWKHVLKYARKVLPHEGTLLKKPDGYVYLDLDDRYIHSLYRKLGESDYEKPPYFRSEDSPGAHISVFDVHDQINPEELGQNFSFKIKDIKIVEPTSNKSYIILEVESPELASLRQKYGLEPLPHGSAFHISIAVKKNR